ncbi:MAG: LysR family transcriptional regulator [Hamadaea sp.]|nr:LysR family transcriptional regulator [Nonomuraea sp.]NUP62065.1 LysR family transcriptional regulator [Nonomuraea sp.]NUR72119.1 LysR family transcriptional regulator [Hamadaea sp.]NUT40988.1 LysR family transcriptional regulator [Thermoactinospora sp.]
MLDLGRLRVLVALARTGSVTGAAQLLHYSQPSVSNQLARLEAEAGAKLIQRVGRGVRLTEAGRILAERAAEILGRIEAAETELSAHVGLRQGRVRLAAFPSALGTFVPVAVARLANEHTGLDVRLTEAEPPQAVEMLRRGEVDVAVIFRYPETPLDETGLHLRPLLDESRYLVTSANEEPDLDLLTYRDSQWIAGCETCRNHLLKLCHSAGFTPQISFDTDDYVAVQSIVAAGLGIATLPGLAIAAMEHRGIRSLALPDSTRQVVAATYGEPPEPPATAAILEALAFAVDSSEGLRNGTLYSPPRPMPRLSP